MRFTHQGKIVVGVVEQISPANWANRPHGRPTIYVVVTQPAWSTQ